MERFRKSDEWASKKYSVKVITFCFKVFLKPTVLKDCPGSHLQLATKQRANFGEESPSGNLESEGSQTGE